MIPKKMLKQWEFLRNDYATVEGKPFDHFFCPFLMRDEHVELCGGHIVNEAFPKSSRSSVLQRKDIDNFYGAVFEADFVNLLKAKGSSWHQLMTDKNLPNKFKPRLMIDGVQKDKHLHDPKQSILHGHFPILFESDKNDPLPIIVHEGSEEMLASNEKKWEMIASADCSIQAMVSLIKSAYLTLFRLLGYRFAIKPAGMTIGYYLLGKFFQETGGDVAEARKLALEFFKPYEKMVRPIDHIEGIVPKGTIEDGRVQVCFGLSGDAWAVIVCVRTGDQLHAVLMPGSHDATSMGHYLEFLKNNEDVLNACESQFDPETGKWGGTVTPVAMRWPKDED